MPFYGNVRELKNIIERSVIMCENNKFGVEHLSYLIRDNNSGNPGDNHNHTLDLHIVEKNTIQKALQITQGNKTRAAHLLNISRQALGRKMNNYGL